MRCYKPANDTEGTLGEHLQLHQPTVCAKEDGVLGEQWPVLDIISCAILPVTDNTVANSHTPPPNPNQCRTELRSNFIKMINGRQRFTPPSPTPFLLKLQPNAHACTGVVAALCRLVLGDGVRLLLCGGIVGWRTCHPWTALIRLSPVGNKIRGKYKAALAIPEADKPPKKHTEMCSLLHSIIFQQKL